MNTLATLRVSNAVRRLNPGHFPPVHVPGLVDAPVRQAVRQKRGDGMNKAERMALEFLQNRHGPSAGFRREPITLSDVERENSQLKAERDRLAGLAQEAIDWGLNGDKGYDLLRATATKSALKAALAQAGQGGGMQL